MNSAGGLQGGGGGMWAPQQVQGSALVVVRIFWNFLNMGHRKMFEKLTIDTF